MPVRRFSFDPFHLSSVSSIHLGLSTALINTSAYHAKPIQKNLLKKSIACSYYLLCQILQLLGFAKGRIVMALEGGYNLRSIANSVFACAKVLLGDKFTFSSPEMQPFESTWRIIQAVMVYMCYCCLALYFLWTSIVMLCLLNFHID